MTTLKTLDKWQRREHNGLASGIGDSSENQKAV
jgi:hypothetical protein